MTKTAFRKTLSANDVGATGAHQVGIHIPKGERELLDFLPYLDPSVKNPSAWLSCIDPEGTPHHFRFVYYNNKLHEPKGTRDEYRITRVTAWFRSSGAKKGDVFEIAREAGSSVYTVSAVKVGNEVDTEVPTRILLSGWRRIH